MKLKTFPAGIHPPDNKQWSAHLPVEECSLPQELVVPLSQHIGAPAEACVEKGDRVGKGQVVGNAKGFVSVPVHASTSGEVIAVEPRLHPTGRALPSVVISADGEDAWSEDLREADPESLSADEIRDRIRAAGIVGMGGATFPAHVKLSPPEEKPIDTLILNGVECEPYLTSDHRVMLEETQKVLEGAKILQRVLGVERVCIGIEANKPDVIEVMEKACVDRDAEVVPLKVKYPQGAERQLILAITGREVPSGALPMEVGCVVQNVGTAAAIVDAVRHGRPLIERVATVTGTAVRHPKNLRVRIGTSLAHLAEQCGGLVKEPAKIIMGGPMMGQTQLSLEVPVVRGTSGLLLFAEGDVPLHTEGPCIRCGQCVRACPARIMPTTISAYARLDLYEEAEEYGALDCIECGCCTYVCPSTISLVQGIRTAKGAIMAKKRKL
ncbi:MAG: electron transport complex subunit RsxC [Desulfuromonadales bacterium]